MAEKRIFRKRRRIRPARAALFLLVLAAVAFAAIGGIRMMGENAAREEEAGKGSLTEGAPKAKTGETETPARSGGADAAQPNARFAGLYYYEEERQDRYLRYEAAHPEFSPDEVVWQVNADLDKPFYEDPSEITDVDSEQALVNKHFYLPADFTPAALVTLDGDYRVTPATKEAYGRLAADATAAGCAIRVGSAYRSIDYQVNLYARYLSEDPGNADNYSARPGFSEHHTGRAVDLIGPAGTLRGFVGTKEAEWVRENAWKYGFIVRYTQENEAITGYESEPWHITYIGEEAAARMREYGISSLEEYVVKYVLHRPPR